MQREAEGAVAGDRVGPSRSAGRIVVAVAVAVVAQLALAGWVVLASYEVRIGDASVDCDAPRAGAAPAGPVARARVDRACEEQRDERRNTALLLGAAVAVAACAVSTVPSRRLTGEELGPAG
jgi:hypothetical protein